ncbi:N-terminal deblocking aminopeptidase [Aeropyrum pernix K1]|uniref:N-terminal deblocking aminopeptidase n=1 Tax=Aeropyrum pernix (strain ATCC 700893 / DSM 11879 / JCM 9820 / NBRC 100138 / K1) TaxID=272557 RepID=Q9YCC1_AERPE|nr:N-terminal deblocking aminopeptidase [Aeropyrum pernix K1]
MSVLETLRELVFTPGPSGFEDLVRSVVVSRLRELGLDPVVDELGNVVVNPSGGEPRLLAAAHMDELGFVITGVGDDGLLAFRKLGGIDDRILPGQHVEILLDGGARIEGVIGITPPHLQLDRGEAEKPLRWHELRIDIGAQSRAEAEELGVKPLQPAVFKKHWSTLAGGRALASRGFDDRAGVALLLELAKRIAEGRVDAGGIALAWTVQEEVGLRGASYVASRMKPKAFLAVDTMACCHPAVTGHTRPGGGPVVRALDNQHITPRWLVELLEEAARSAGLELQYATAGGTTDAAAFQRTGVPSAAIGIPLKYTHSTAEVLYLSDLEGALKLLEHLPGRLG